LTPTGLYNSRRVDIKIIMFRQPRLLFRKIYWMGIGSSLGCFDQSFWSDLALVALGPKVTNSTFGKAIHLPYFDCQ